VGPQWRLTALRVSNIHAILADAWHPDEYAPPTAVYSTTAPFGRSLSVVADPGRLCDTVGQGRVHYKKIRLVTRVVINRRLVPLSH